MPQMIIANCTQQHVDFRYREPLTGKMRRMMIPMGAQARVHEEAPISTLKAIIAQHEVYGLKPAAEIPRTKSFTGLCFSFDKPVDIEHLMLAAEGNGVVLDASGQQMRKELAVAINDQIRTESDAPVNAVEIEVRQAPQHGQTETPSNALAQGIEVIDPATTARVGRRQRNR